MQRIILDTKLVAKILADSKANKLTMSPVDWVSFPLWLVGATPSNSAEQALYEAGQIVTQSRDDTLRAASPEAAAGGTFGTAYQSWLAAQPISEALRARIGALPAPAAKP